MKTNTSALISIGLGILCFISALYRSESWIFILSSLAFAIVSVFFALSKIVFKESNKKKNYYYLIILIGFCFLLFGLLK